MKYLKSIFVIAGIAILVMLSCISESNDYTQMVNPMIGTDFTGNTYPGVSAPFGMVQLSPDNGLSGWDRISGYFYPDSTIAGFSHTHLSGTGAGDLYDISFLPVTFPLKDATSELGVHSRFTHKNEFAKAGYYRVRLEDYGIDVELTSTYRCGIQRYTFPEGNSAVILNLAKAMNWDFTNDSFIEIVDSCTIRGYRFSKGWASDQRLYFVSRFSKPFNRYALIKSSIKPNHGFTAVGKGYRGIFHYRTTKDEQLVVRTALSAVSYEGAMKNLEREASDNNFSTYLHANQKLWNEVLGRVKVRMKNYEDEVTFYTALYHSMLAPTLYCDVDGKYRGPDGAIHQSQGWNNYSTFSLWDTYRAAHPLYLIIQPGRARDMMLSLMAFANQQGGRLPVWNFAGCETDMMIGYHAAVVLAEAYLKGIPFDGKEALKLALLTANSNHYRGIGLYKDKGYIPYDKENESVSKTLEYAYDDYAIARLAEALGEKEISEEMMRRSRSYKHLWDSTVGFFRPRDSNGKWLSPFDPKKYSVHYTESNAWQYLWNVAQNPDHLVELMGGKRTFEAKLDQMFSESSKAGELPIFSTGMIGQYAHGNEPSHHVAYLYNYTDHPEKGERLLGQIMKEFYNNTPGGLCGNEDCGQMSAWYVFSALGFYPLDPISGTYEVGTPLIESATIKLPAGKKLLITVQRSTPDAYHVRELIFNGHLVKNRRLQHKELMQGGRLLFKME